MNCTRVQLIGFSHTVYARDILEVNKFLKMNTTSVVLLVLRTQRRMTGKWQYKDNNTKYAPEKECATKRTNVKTSIVRGTILGCKPGKVSKKSLHLRFLTVVFSTKNHNFLLLFTS